MFASAYFRFGLNFRHGVRARHAVRTTRHQERDGWVAASASRLSRRRSFFFMPTTERLLPPAGLVDPSLPLRSARVHGGGEAGELKGVLRAVSVVCGDFVVIEYRAYHVGVYSGRPQRVEACPTLCLASCFSDLMPLLSPRAIGLVRPQRPLLGMNRDRRCEQGERDEHDESHHFVPSTAAGPCASLAHHRNLPH